MIRCDNSTFFGVGFGIKHKGEWRYLTIENDGTAKASSKHMDPDKDRWYVYDVNDRDEESREVYLRRVGSRYILSSETLSKKTCPDLLSTEAEFNLLYDTEGRVALKSQQFNRFLGVDLDAFPNGELQCKATEPGDAEWWTIKLFDHPQIHLRSTESKQYAYYNQEANQIHCNQIVPWGQKCQLTLEFLDGKYVVKTIDNKYLHRNGDLVKDPSPDTLFALHMKFWTGIALMDCKGKFLNTVGYNCVLQTKDTGRKHFEVEASMPQVSLKSSDNGKYLSIKSGIILHILFIILLL